MYFLKIQIGGDISIGIEANGLFHELLCHLKPLGELPELHAAVCDRLIQRIHCDQTPDGPFVGAVFVALALVTMTFVRHGDSKPEKKSAIEALGE